MFSTLYKYRKKLFRVAFFEIYYSIRLGKNFYKVYNDLIQADSMPCPYYFIYVISKFIKKNSISSFIDLGSGNGRVINYLSKKTNSKLIGFEKDLEMYNYSIKNLSKNASVENKDINLINYNRIQPDCYFLNTPILSDKMLNNLINKIFLSNVRSKRKYYIVIINIDNILKNIKLDTIFEQFDLKKFIDAGPIRTLRIYESKSINI